MSTFPTGISFQALLERGGPSFMPTQIVIVPEEVVERLGSKATRRVLGTLNGHPIRVGLQRLGTGERFLMLNKDTCQAAGVQLGQHVTLCLAPDPNPDQVDLPQELAEALEAWPEAATGFQGHSPSSQRAMAQFVRTAKRPETRAQRSVELARKLAVGAHPFKPLPY